MNFSAAELLLLPVSANLLVILAVWLYYSLTAAPRGPAGRSRIYRCAACRCVYADYRDVPLARCRRCGCMNEAVKR